MNGDIKLVKRIQLMASVDLKVLLQVLEQLNKMLWCITVTAGLFALSWSLLLPSTLIQTCLKISRMVMILILLYRIWSLKSRLHSGITCGIIVGNYMFHTLVFSRCCQLYMMICTVACTWVLRKHSVKLVRNSIGQLGEKIQFSMYLLVKYARRLNPQMWGMDC